MAISAAKLEANRRNAKLSSGPKTAAGKERSSRNAVTHGLRAEKLIVLEEDPQVLEDRRAAWRACLLPCDDVEERLVDDAVVHTWMQDRARRAQAGRLSANILNYGVDQAQITAEEVSELGRRLFTDRLGPLTFYPTGSDYDEGDDVRTPTTSFAGTGVIDLDRPAFLLLRLQSTLLGCEWLLSEWAGLKAILDQGQPWVSSDKLKAVRLLGKQPFDAIDDKDVAMVFLASFVLKKKAKGRWDWEILMETTDDDYSMFRRNAADRELESLKPKDAEKAREALLGIIERATGRLTLKAEAHRERARAMAALAPDFLAFDDSPAGERLRRFDLASGRALARSLVELRIHRHSVVSSPLSVVSSPLSVVSGPLSVAACEAEALTEAISPNKPTAAHENVTNEPTAGRENVTNEPTANHEIATNEPTTNHEIVTNEATANHEIATNEPTAVHAIVTNEPTAAHEIVTNEPTVAQINAPNEPIDAYENAPNEPKVATGGENGESAELSAQTNHGDSPESEIDTEKAWAWVSKGIEERKAARAESLRRLNEESQHEARAAKAIRDARKLQRRAVAASMIS